MRIIRFILGFNLAWLILYAAPARATPPLTIQVQDHPIAVSETHLYVMRYVADNMGRYQAERSKTYILKLETRTSKLIEFHKLQEAQQGENQAFSEIKANKDFNLFAYLENEKAFQTGLIKPRPHQKISTEKMKASFRLSRDYKGQLDGKYQEIKEHSLIYDANLRALLNPTLAEVLSDYIGPIPDPKPNLEIYTIPQEIDPPSDGSCHITQVVNAPQPLSKINYDIRFDEFLAYVKCATGADDLQVETILPLALTFNRENKG